MNSLGHVFIKKIILYVFFLSHNYFNVFLFSLMCSFSSLVIGTSCLVKTVLMIDPLPCDLETIFDAHYLVGIL